MNESSFTETIAKASPITMPITPAMSRSRSSRSTQSRP